MSLLLRRRELLGQGGINFEGTALGSFVVKADVRAEGAPNSDIKEIEIIPDGNGYFGVELPFAWRYWIGTQASTTTIENNWTYSNSNLLTVTKMPDTNHISSFRNMFKGCTSLTSVCLFDTSEGTNFCGMFKNCTSITAIPYFNTSKGIDFGEYEPGTYYSGNGMFSGCTSLITAPILDTSNGVSFSWMFSDCSNMTTVSLLDTSNGTQFSRMFYHCSSLHSIPRFNTSEGLRFTEMFEMSGIRYEGLPLLDTSKGTNFSHMFSNCYELTTIPLFDTSNGVDFSGMFAWASNFSSCPNLNTSKGENFGAMFMDTALVNAPTLNTSKGKVLAEMFSLCDSLVSAPEYNCSSATNLNLIYQSCTSLTTCGGLLNAKGSSSESLSSTTYKGLAFMDSPLTHDSLMNIINKLATAQLTVNILGISTDAINSLTEAEKAIATNKGWTLYHTPITN